MELRWDGVRIAGRRDADAQASRWRRTPPPQWVRVVGGFTEFQFAEKRLPTLEEINAVAPDTPVFILHLYDRALLNGAALRAVGYTKDTPDPPGGEIERDTRGQSDRAADRPAERDDPLRDAGQGPEAAARVPDQLDPPLHARAEPAGRDRRHRRRRRLSELSRRLRRSSSKLHRRGELTVRIAYNLFTQKPKRRAGGLPRWASMVEPGQGDDYLPPQRRRRDAGLLGGRLRGLSSSRVPTCRPTWRASSKRVVRLLAENRWPFRLHATYDETISRALDVFEKVNRDVPLDGPALVLRPRRDHLPSATSSASRRSAAASRSSTGWPTRASISSSATAPRRPKRTPPIDRMLEAACRSAAAPTPPAWPATIPGSRSAGWSPAGPSAACELYPRRNRLDRETALRLWTENVTLVLQRGGQEGPDRSRASSRIWSFLTATISPVPKTRSPILTSDADDGRRQGRLRRRRLRKLMKPLCRPRCRTGRRCAPSAAMPHGRIPSARPSPRFGASSL